jgi:uncharacterized membrane protein
MYYRGYTMMGNAGGWLMVLTVLFWTVLVVGLVVLTIWAVRSMRVAGHERLHEQARAEGGQPPAPVTGHDEAIAIARRRFASGEIDKDQFDELTKALGG